VRRCGVERFDLRERVLATVSLLISVWKHGAMAKRVRLAEARKAAGYTQESFAEVLGVDRSTVARWEEPLPYLRPKITRLLGVSRDELKELLRLPPSSTLHAVVELAGADVKRRDFLPGLPSLQRPSLNQRCSR
jgi:transcriptional regulator with XRE-family HTH domain